MIIADHVEIVCTDPDCGPACYFCDDGLFGCSVCGSREGATTTHCSKKMMTGEQANLVYAGKLNYRGGVWLQECSEHSPAYWGDEMKMKWIEEPK